MRKFLCLCGMLISVSLFGQTIDLELTTSDTVANYELYREARTGLTLRNTGTATATNIIVAFGASDSLKLARAEAFAGTTLGFDGLWRVDSLAAGANAFLILDHFPTQDFITHTLFAQVFAVDQPDADSTPNSTFSLNTVTEDDELIKRFVSNRAAPGLDADLSIRLLRRDSTYVPFEHVNFTLEITNNGPDRLTDIVGAVSSDIGFNDALVCGNRQVLEVGESYVTDCRILPDNLSSTAGTVTIMFTSAQSDPDSTNNTVQFTIQRVLPPAPDTLNLTLNLTADADAVQRNVPRTFYVDLVNNSNLAATDLQVFMTDPIDGRNGILYADHRLNSGELDVVTHTWNIDTLPAGAAVNLALTVFPTAFDTVNFFAVVVSNAADRVIASTATNEVYLDLPPVDNSLLVKLNNQFADLAVDLFAVDSTFNDFENFRFGYAVTNNGPDVVTDVRVFIPRTIFGFWNRSFSLIEIDSIAVGETVRREFNDYFINTNEAANGIITIRIDSPQIDDNQSNNVDTLTIFRSPAGGGLQLAETSRQRIGIAPNPVAQVFTLTIWRAQPGAGNLLIFNNLGQLVRRLRTNWVTGFNQLKIDATTLPVGSYFLGTASGERWRFIKR